MKRIKEQAETRVKNVASSAKTHQMLKDKLFLWMVVVNATLLVAFTINVLLRIRPQDFAVNIRYSSFEGFAIGHWSNNFDVLLFSLLVTVGNIVVAAKVFRKSRVATFIILFATIFINIFTVIVGNLIISSRIL